VNRFATFHTVAATPEEAGDKKTPLTKVNSLPKVEEHAVTKTSRSDPGHHDQISKTDSGHGSGSGIDYKTTLGNVISADPQVLGLSEQSDSTPNDHNGHNV